MLIDITITQVDLEGDDSDLTGQFVFAHADNGEGICEICAPWLGRICNGDGSDGVPVPPLHPNCKCYLMPLDAAKSAGDGTPVQEENYAWMESLSSRELAKVVGVARAELVRDGEITVKGMYYKGMPLTLEEMGYSRTGEKIGPRRAKAIRARYEEWQAEMEAGARLL